MLEKTCNKCKQAKPLTEFHKSKRAKDGYKSDCKLCRNKEGAEYRKRNPGRKTVRKYLNITCEDCGVHLRRRTDQIKEVNRCRVCANRVAAYKRMGQTIPSMWTGKHLSCDQCGKEVYKPGSQIHTHNFCCRECYNEWQKINFDNQNFIKSADNKGEKNGRYKHGKRIGGHDRHKELKKQIAQRDGKGCLMCKSKENLHVHRITPGSMGGEYKLDNTVTLCKKHHATVHKDYDKWKSILLKLISKIA